MPIKYIFFDCFNTLIDDFDEYGDESGMRPLAHIPVKHGLYDVEHEFHDDYLAWRRNYWSNGNCDEVLLRDRLNHIFLEQMNRNRKDVNLTLVVEEMLTLFHEIFPTTIRTSNKVRAVLDNLKDRIPMSVVSNFFLPDYPEYLLAQHDLHHYFEFIIDSAQLMVKKPGKEIYNHVLAKAGIKKGDISQVLFIGDNLKNDVLTPMEIGMQAWYFDRSEERPSAQAPGHIKSFKNWDILSLLFKQEFSRV
ncbi:MAG: HAD family hydrolase [Saprospiraceae bacterium]|nr:HAD family hydrolase [Saprospiraceae bacterium]